MSRPWVLDRLRVLDRLGLRGRLILLGTAGLAVGLAIGGVVLVGVLQSTLESAVDDAARQTARDVAELIDAGRLPDPIPAGGTTIVQVVDADGQVRAASLGGDRLVSSVPPRALATSDGSLGYLPGSRFGVSEVVRVVTVTAGPAADRQTVVVAVPAGEIADSVQIVRVGLLVGYAVLLATVAALAWRLVSATLRPVTALREGAEEITGTGSAASLPVPRARDEIHALAVTLNGMLARLDAARKRQRAFVADAAHELRSPLASLRTQLEVAAAVDGRDVDDLLPEVQRMTRLVDDLLLLARVDDAVPRRRVSVELTSLVRTTLARYAERRVPVVLSAEEVPPVLGDPDALTRVLENVLDNAVRHARSSVRVELAAGPVLTVSDDGPGIPAAERVKAFGRFTRLADARDRDSGGSGLGLAIVRELVTQHGGTVTLSDADPYGLCVEVRLPASGCGRRRTLSRRRPGGRGPA